MSLEVETGSGGKTSRAVKADHSSVLKSCFRNCLEMPTLKWSAILERGVSGGGDGVGGDVKLDVIGITVEMETMVANDVAKGEQIKYEKERTKY